MLAVMLLAVMFAALFAVSATAQKINLDNKDKTKVPKVALWPLIFSEGSEVCNNKTAIGTCKETIDSVFQKLGFEQMEAGKVIGTIRSLGLKQSESDQPTPEEMLRLGKEIKADYVIAAKWHWNIRSITTITGLKTKAYATFETTIVNVAKEEIEFHPDPYKCDSEKKLSNEEVAGFLLVSVLVPFFSGGPKTPHMQHSGQTACVLSLKPWLEKQQPDQEKRIKIDK